MPALLTNRQKSPRDQALEIIERLNIPKKDKARLLELVGKI